MPKTLVFGNEPYLIDKFRKKILEEVETPEMNFWDTDTFTEVEERFICQSSFLKGRKVLFLSSDTIAGCQQAVDLLQNRGKKTEVYFFPKEVDKRSKVYKAFNKQEIHICNKLSNDKFEMTILQYVKKSGCQISNDAYQLYLQRINYYSDVTNLYDVHHSLERICSVKQITKEIVESMVTNNEQEDIFSLVRLASQHQADKMYYQADLILRRQENNVIGILSLLLHSYRLAYKMGVCNCTLKDLGISYQTYVPKLPPEQCSEIISVLNDTINLVKRGYYKQDTALKIALARLLISSEKKV